MLQAVVFDVDGVLIDSVAAAYTVKAQLLKEIGVDLDKIPDPYGERHKGSSLQNLIEAVQQHAGIDIDEETFKSQSVERVRQELERTASVDPELRRLLSDLKARGVPLAIATSGIKPSVENKLQILGLRDFFDVFVTADDVSRHKPDPACYQLAMERLAVEPAHTIIFEDSSAGIAAGLASGAKVIYFTKYASGKNAPPSVAATVDSWDEVDIEFLRRVCRPA